MFPNCFCYEPGVVLSLERAYCDPFRADVGLSPAGSTAYYPASAAALRRYYTTPGDELRTLNELVTRDQVLAASLNYLGETASVQATPVGVELTDMASAVWFLGEVGGTTTGKVFVEGKCSPQLEMTAAVPVVIDVSLEHAKRVVYQLREAYRGVAASESEGPVTLTMQSGIESATDLFAYCLLLLAAGELKGGITTVNLSVDLGKLCTELGGIRGPVTAELFSFPFFASCLDRLHSGRSEERTDPPVIVAAAGNTRRDLKRRWRLAFPASLPDVIPVTCAAQNGPLAGPVDWPAVGPLKPCFNELPLSFPDKVDNMATSYACAAFAGRVAAIWDRLGRQGLGRFGKVARLLAMSEGEVIPQAMPGYSPIILHRLKTDNSAPERSGKGFFRDMLGELARVTGREFLLTGSAAFIEKWLEKHPHLGGKANKFLHLVGDLDLLHTGSALDKNTRVNMRQTIQAWFAASSGDTPGRLPEEIIAHPVRMWAGDLHFAQCIIPDAQLFATAGGLIDPWKVTQNRGGLPPLFVPTYESWAHNPQWRGGEGGLADGIMVYVNRLLIEAKLWQIVGTTEGLPNWLRDDIDAQTAIKGFVPESKIDGVWFGRGRDKPSDRLTRRLMRAAALMRLIEDHEGLPRYPRLVDSVRRIVQNFTNGQGI